MILCTFRCLESLIAAGLLAVNGQLIVEGHAKHKIPFPLSTTSSCMPSSEQNRENPWDFLPGFNPCYRGIIGKAVTQQEREGKARKKEAELIAKGEFVGGRRLVRRVWNTPNQDELKLKRQQKLKQQNLKNTSQVQSRDDDSSATQKPTIILPPIPAITPDIESLRDHECEKWSKSSVSLITGILNNPPLLNLATESINRIPTFLGRYAASEMWNNLSLIQEPSICAQAVTYILQQKSLTYQIIVADAWCEFLAKIVDPRLRSRVVTDVMNQEIANIKAVSCAWRLLLVGDNSMFADTSTIPEYVIATMEQQTTLEALDSYAKVWLRSRLL